MRKNYKKQIKNTLFVLILARIDFGASQIKEDLPRINFGAQQKMS